MSELCVILLQKHNTCNIYSHEAATSFTYTTFDKTEKKNRKKRREAKTELNKKRE